MKKHIFLLVLLGVFVLAACGNVYEKEPVGIGPDYSELKQSPCACLKLEKAPELPFYMS